MVHNRILCKIHTTMTTSTITHQLENLYRAVVVIALAYIVFQIQVIKTIESKNGNEIEYTSIKLDYVTADINQQRLFNK